MNHYLSKSKKLAIGLAAMTGLSSQVSANTMTCGNFSLTATTVVSCSNGTGNIAGNSGVNDPWMPANPGYAYVDASNQTGAASGTNDGWLTSTPPATGVSGTFSIDPAAYGPTGYDLFAVGFKSATYWTVFMLADNTLSGSWINNDGKNLSHAMLYGSGVGSSGEGSVPVPGSLALLGIGVIAAGLLRKRKA